MKRLPSCPSLKQFPRSSKRRFRGSRHRSVPVFTSKKALDADSKPANSYSGGNRRADDDAFYVTVIEEKNVGTRNSLLLGTLVFMICALTVGMIYSIFMKDIDIGSINGDDLFNAVIAETTPMTVEEEQKKATDNKAGGGGGSGNKEKDPASQGDLADQQKNPTRPPNVNTMKSDTPMLETPSTQGNNEVPEDHMANGAIRMACLEIQMAREPAAASEAAGELARVTETERVPATAKVPDSVTESAMATETALATERSVPRLRVA